MVSDPSSPLFYLCFYIGDRLIRIYADLSSDHPPPPPPPPPPNRIYPFFARQPLPTPRTREKGSELANVRFNEISSGQSDSAFEIHASN